MPTVIGPCGLGLGYGLYRNTKEDSQYETAVKALTDGGCHTAAVFSFYDAA